jgi:hypothetical protein
VPIAGIVDNDERIQMVGPMADRQQLSGNLDGPMVGARVAAAAPEFHLQIPVRISHGAFTLPAGGYSQMVTWVGN